MVKLPARPVSSRHRATEARPGRRSNSIGSPCAIGARSSGRWVTAVVEPIADAIRIVVRRDAGRSLSDDAGRTGIRHTEC
jgi:hypothetical protein